jgi:hypothetical protein
VISAMLIVRAEALPIFEAVFVSIFIGKGGLWVES